MSPTRTHYDTLGVPADASGTAIREAYRELARRYHPDRAGSAAGADRMPEVNEAYRVLSDPARRAMYDASLRPGASARNGTTGAATTSAHGTEFVPAGHDDDYLIRLRASRQPISVPWRTIGVAALAVIVGIVVLAQFTDGTDEPVIDGILRVGDCAEVLADGRAAEVPCAGAAAGGTEVDLVVRAVIPFDERCAGGWSLHQDRQGMGNVCLERRR